MRTIKATNTASRQDEQTGKESNEEQDRWYGKERKIGKTGRGGSSHYVTLPPSFWEKIKGKELRPYEIGNIIVFVPSEPIEPKICELDFQIDDPDFLEYQIISAYLNNYRRLDVTLKEDNEKCIDCIERLPKKLRGLSPSFGGTMARREIDMSTVPEPIPNLLNKMHRSVKEIHKLNQKILSSLNAPTHIELVTIDALENDIDKQSFLIKRLFCIVLERLYLAGQAGIEDLTQIIHYENVNSNLERAGDLQFQIFKELIKLLEKFKDRDKLKKMLQSEDLNHPFLNYHKAAQDMLDDAYSKDLQKIVDIIKTKKQDTGPEAVRHRGGYISKELMKTIAELTVAHPELNCLDFRIWGLTGTATNIAEAWLNMMGPVITQKKFSREPSKAPAQIRVAQEPTKKKK